MKKISQLLSRKNLTRNTTQHGIVLLEEISDHMLRTKQRTLFIFILDKLLFCFSNPDSHRSIPSYLKDACDYYYVCYIVVNDNAYGQISLCLFHHRNIMIMKQYIIIIIKKISELKIERVCEQHGCIGWWRDTWWSCELSPPSRLLWRYVHYICNIPIVIGCFHFQFVECLQRYVRFNIAANQIIIIINL